ncbi:MAG: energy transducer TonB, partial [Pseudomonadales bacterium]
VSTSTDMSGTFGFISDGNYLPIVKVQPVYPRTALVRGLGGWVVLEFTVDKIGRVVDPVVIDNCVSLFKFGEECEDQPGSLFDHSALRAAVKFKYKPKVEDGVPIATHHVRHKISFELDEE